MPRVYASVLSRFLRRYLFQTRTFLECRARYNARSDEHEQLARQTWAVHGVCLECRCWSIQAGRCADCGIAYGPISEAEVREQIILANELP